jgi:serine protease Do
MLGAGLGWAQSSYLGIGLRELPNAAGPEVTLVRKGSPAEAAGLKAGDVITQFNGLRVSSNEQLTTLVQRTPPGRQVRLDILRGGVPQTLTARIGLITNTMSAGGVPGIVVPRMPDVPQQFTAWRSPVLGVEAEGLQPGQFAEFFGVTEGVLVRSVAAGSAAEKAGIKAGDVITGVGSTKVTTPADITNRLRVMTGNTIAVALQRNHQPVTLNVTFEPQ